MRCVRRGCPHARPCPTPQNQVAIVKTHCLKLPQASCQTHDAAKTSIHTATKLLSSAFQCNDSGRDAVPIVTQICCKKKINKKNKKKRGQPRIKVYNSSGLKKKFESKLNLFCRLNFLICSPAGCRGVHQSTVVSVCVGSVVVLLHTCNFFLSVERVAHSS